MSSKLYVIAGTLILTMCWAIASGQPARRQSPPALGQNVVLNIIRHEDERRWDEELKRLLANKDAKVRQRAALAAGRIGDERAVPVLTELLLTDRDPGVRDMAAGILEDRRAGRSIINSSIR